mgnify:CR=1 FL=1
MSQQNLPSPVNLWANNQYISFGNHCWSSDKTNQKVNLKYDAPLSMVFLRVNSIIYGGNV